MYMCDGQGSEVVEDYQKLDGKVEKLEAIGRR